MLMRIFEYLMRQQYLVGAAVEAVWRRHHRRVGVLTNNAMLGIHYTRSTIEWRKMSTDTRAQQTTMNHNPLSHSNPNARGIMPKPKPKTRTKKHNEIVIVIAVVGEYPKIVLNYDLYATSCMNECVCVWCAWNGRGINIKLSILCVGVSGVASSVTVTAMVGMAR